MATPNGPPRCVRRACWLLLVGAAVGLCGVIAAILARHHLEAAAPAFVAAVGDPTVEQSRALPDTRSSLRYDLVVAAASVLLLPALALVIRRPWRRARLVALCVMGTLAVALAFGIAAGPEAQLSPTGNEPTQIRRTLQDLLMGWYPTTHELLVLAQAACLVAVTVFLLREAAGDYYTRITPRRIAPHHGFKPGTASDV